MKLSISVIIILVLMGCSAPISMISLCSNAITYSVTGKTNSDLFVSVLVGKDCKLVRVLQENEKVCRVE